MALGLPDHKPLGQLKTLLAKLLLFVDELIVGGGLEFALALVAFLLLLFLGKFALFPQVTMTQLKHFPSCFRLSFAHRNRQSVFKLQTLHVLCLNLCLCFGGPGHKVEIGKRVQTLKQFFRYVLNLPFQWRICSTQLLL